MHEKDASRGGLVGACEVEIGHVPTLPRPNRAVMSAPYENGKDLRQTAAAVVNEQFFLFLPQGHDRIDERGAARRKETSQPCDRREQQRDRKDGRDLVRPEAVEQRSARTMS